MRKIIWLLAALVLTGCSWSQVHSFPTHTGFQPFEPTLNTENVGLLVPKWHSNLGIAGSATSPAIAGGKVFVNADRLNAFDVDDSACTDVPDKYCSPLWTADTGGHDNCYYPGINCAGVSSPAVDRGIVFVGTQTGFLYGFDANGINGCSGTPKICAPIWKASIGNFGTIASPTIENGMVYIGGDNGLFYAFDATGVTNCSGTNPVVCGPVWEMDTSTNSRVTSAAVAGGVAYVASRETLYAVDSRTHCTGSLPKICQPIWKASLGDSVAGTPAVDGGKVFVSTIAMNPGATGLWAFDALPGSRCGGQPLTCAPAWTAATPPWGGRDPSIAYGRVFTNNGAYDRDGIQNCDQVTHTCQPLFDMANIGNMAIANGVVYVGGPWGLHAKDAAGTQFLFTYSQGPTDLSESSGPVVVGGRVYQLIGHAIYAFGLR